MPPPVDPCLSFEEHRPAFDDHADGFYLGVPEATYHGLDACSASRLTLVMRSPAHAEHAIRNPTPSTSAQRLGSAVHRACLQRDTFDTHYVISEYSSRTKAYKALVWLISIRTYMSRTLLTTLLATVLAVSALAQSVPCEDGEAGEYTCDNVDLLAHLPLNATPDLERSSSDIWGWTDPETGIEYAIINQYNYTAFIDLSDPTAPFVVGTLDAPSATYVRDAKTYADHAFIGTDASNAPIQVFDLTRLRDVENPPAVFTADAEYAMATGPRNISINPTSGFAYLTGVDSDVCQGSLHIVDVRVPAEPTYAGCYGLSDETAEDAQCVTYDGPDADYTGREVCFISGPYNPGRVTIVDVSDKAAPELVAEVPYPNSPLPFQGWLTDDARYFLLSDLADSRTIVFNVEDLNDPELTFEHFGEAGSTSGSFFVRDEFVYQANFTGGLRILDLAELDSNTLTEVAFFDTYPESNETGVNGAFGVYPYFSSGIVVVSDMARGLFVLQPRLGQMTSTDAPVQPSAAAKLEVYPNPNSNRTAVALTAPSAQSVKIVVYDVLGRRIAMVFTGTVEAGTTRRFPFDTAGVPAGSYVVRAEGETFDITQPLTVIR